MPIDAASLRARYPAFAAMPDATLAYWLADAARIVTPAWGEDQEPATLALAAHGLARSGALAGGGAALPAGLTSFRSGAFSVTVDAGAAQQSAAGGYASTSYGLEFLPMLRRNTGWPFLAGVPC